MYDSASHLFSTGPISLVSTQTGNRSLGTIDVQNDFDLLSGNNRLYIQLWITQLLVAPTADANDTFLFGLYTSNSNVGYNNNHGRIAAFRADSGRLNITDTTENIIGLHGTATLRPGEAFERKRYLHLGFTASEPLTAGEVACVLTDQIPTVSTPTPRVTVTKTAAGDFFTRATSW